MRKIPGKLDNFIDDTLITIIDTIQPYFYKLGFIPNTLTTISLICWLFALYFFINDGVYYTLYAVLFMILSYFFDCFDGHFARSYNMVTKFGDYYDHISDVSKVILLIYFILINKIKFHNTIQDTRLNNKYPYYSLHIYNLTQYQMEFLNREILYFYIMI